MTPAWLSGLPDLDGEILVEALDAYARDAGNLLWRAPSAVLRPSSASDVQKAVRHCAERGVPIAARGQGHATDGQALVQGGLVIDMSSLAAIHSIRRDVADVDAGVTWSALTGAALKVGRTPPVLTGYLGLSVGGTLSVGGISSGNRRGAQVDRVQRLQIVTGSGELLWCSEREHRQLFDIALAGQGQFGVILRAELDLVAAPGRVRLHVIEHSDSDSLFADLFTLLDRGELDDVYDSGGFDISGRFVHRLTAAKFYDDGAAPDDSWLLRGLRASAASTSDTSYRDYVFRVDRELEELRAAGGWEGVQHPWFDVFLSGDTAQAYVQEVLSSMTREDVGDAGFFLLFPQLTRRLSRPMLSVPRSSKWVMLLDVLTSAPLSDPPPDFARRMLARNRSWFDAARSVGATRYPIGCLDFSPRDWELHYGQRWRELERLKRRYDPAGVLTPGPRIFSPTAPGQRGAARAATSAAGASEAPFQARHNDRNGEGR